MDDNIQIMKRSCELQTSHEINKLLELLVKDAVWEDVALGIVAKGHAEIRDMFEGIYKSMPDYAATLASTVADEKRGGAEWVMSGTLLGPYRGQRATGKSFSVRASANVQFSQGRITRWTDYWSESSFKRQVGLE